MLAIQENLAAASRSLASAAHVAYPGDDCCRLYDYSSYSGHSRKFCHNGSKTVISLTPNERNWNNLAASWACGKNVKYAFFDYDHTDYQGWWYSISGAGHIMNKDMGSWNDDITTVVLRPYDATEVGAITVFQYAGCTGASARLEWMDEHGLGGRHSASDMYKAGLEQDRISSVAVPYGYTAELYTDDGFKGDVQVIKGRYTSSFGAAEMACQRTWDDTFSSVIVKKDREAVAIGSWESITTTEAQTYELTVGLIRGHETAFSTEASNSITMAMELGVEFEGAGSASSSISSELSMSVTSDVRDTFEYSTTEKLSTACNAKGREGAGLFQWVVSTGSGDDRVTARTRHFVCRYGAGYWNVEPACPWNACVDAECKECRSGWAAPSVKVWA